MTVSTRDLEAAVPDDALAAELAAIRKRFDDAAAYKDLAEWATVVDRTGGGTEYDWMARSLVDVPRLMAVVEALLRQHRAGAVMVLGHLCRLHENHRHFSITCAEAADVTACPDCAATASRSCAGCGWLSDQCPVRRAISAALLGEDRTDG